MKFLQKERELFLQFQKNGEGLQKIGKLEKPYLFDFLLIMTGNKNLALRSCETAIATVLSSSAPQNLDDLRIELYFQAKKLCSLSWGNSVELLENTTLNEGNKNPNFNKATVEKIKKFILIYKVLVSMESQERESLLLAKKLKFSPDAARKIAECLNIEDVLQGAFRSLLQRTRLEEKEALELLTELPNQSYKDGDHSKEMIGIDSVVYPILKQRAIQNKKNRQLIFFILFIFLLLVMFSVYDKPHRIRTWSRILLGAFKNFFQSY